MRSRREVESRGNRKTKTIETEPDSLQRVYSSFMEQRLFEKINKD
jgi:hypothetical protein